MKRDFLSVTDLNREEIEDIIVEAKRLKIERLEGRKKRKDLEGKFFALIFEKPSLRTRVTFETALYELGAGSVYLSNQDIQLGKRESIEDVAKNLDRWVDGVIARVYSHNSLIEMSKNMKAPLINALSDLEHPCQALADYMTIWEKKGQFKVNLTFVGDGNNVAHSLMLLTAILGGNFNIACPKGYEPKMEIIKKAQEIAKESGANIQVLNDPAEALKDADFVYTDVWASMGQEDEFEERKRVFAPYQVNSELMKYAPENALVMHCLPAKRGLEITDDILDGPKSIVLEQAENRLHTEKALLLKLFKVA